MQNGSDAAEELCKSADAGLAFANAHIRVFFHPHYGCSVERSQYSPAGVIACKTNVR